MYPTVGENRSKNFWRNEVERLENDYVSPMICEERCRRLEDEDKRQNERIKQLELSISEIHSLSLSTEKLATTMEQMLVEQKEQGQRISKLEERDGQKWRDIVKAVLTAVAGAAIGVVFTLLGLQ